jgi:hypothetical protein
MRRPHARQTYRTTAGKKTLGERETHRHVSADDGFGSAGSRPKRSPQCPGLLHPRATKRRRGAHAPRDPAPRAPSTAASDALDYDGVGRASGEERTTDEMEVWWAVRTQRHNPAGPSRGTRRLNPGRRRTGDHSAAAAPGDRRAVHAIAYGPRKPATTGPRGPRPLRALSELAWAVRRTRCLASPSFFFAVTCLP